MRTLSLKAAVAALLAAGALAAPAQARRDRRLPAASHARSRPTSASTAAGRARLGGDRRARSGSTARSTPTSAPASGRAARSGSRTTSSRGAPTRSRVRFDYADESDRVRYPIPRGVHIEGGPRRRRRPPRAARRPHALPALRAVRAAQGRPARWTRRLRRDLEPALEPRLRPAGWTSADAAGLPILPLLARYQEVGRGPDRPRAADDRVAAAARAFVFPARHFASSDTDPALPRMGERLRLKAGVDISGLPRQARVVAQAMQASTG